jgi:hypothetical protein
MIASDRIFLFPSPPALCRGSTSYDQSKFKGVDARHKAGHDERKSIDLIQSDETAL